MVHPEEKPNHTHSHEEFSCDTISDRRREYISDHLETMKTRCADYQTCVEAITADNSVVSIIEGRDLQLKSICRHLMPRGSLGPKYRAGERKLRTKNRLGNETLTLSEEKQESSHCSRDARRTIRRDIVQHVTEAMEDGEHHPEWQAVSECLRSDSQNDVLPDKMFTTICRRATNRSLVCGNKTVHHTLENFFNRQLEHLQCLCRALPPTDSLPMGVIAGSAAAGGIVLLVLLVVCVYFCYCRPRKQLRKALRRNNTSWDSWGPAVYMGGSAGGDSVYSEIDEKPREGQAFLRGGKPAERPPTLPARYCHDPTRLPPVGADGYLEAGASASSGINLSAPDQVEYLVEKPVADGADADEVSSEYLRLLPLAPTPFDEGPGGEGQKPPPTGDYFILEPDAQGGVPVSPGPAGTGDAATEAGNAHVTDAAGQGGVLVAGDSVADDGDKSSKEIDDEKKEPVTAGSADKAGDSSENGGAKQKDISQTDSGPA